MPSSVQSSSSRETGRFFRTVPSNVGAVSTLSIKERIEDALKNLNPGEELFVDTEGELHQGKSQFVQHGCKPLVSFKATSSGYVVTAGLPPRNNTYVSSTEHGFHSQKPLEYAITLSSGDFIRLSEQCVFRIPDSQEGLPDPRQKNARLNGTKGLEAHLAYAEQGDVLILGRAIVDSLPIHVSRQHVTAKVVGKEFREDGSFSMAIALSLGVPADKPVSVIHGEQSTPVVGKRFVAGSVVEAGGMQIRVPHPRNSLEEQSLYSVSMFEGEALQHSVAELISVAPAASYSLVEAQIDRGVSLINEQKYTEAIALFMQQDLLESLGYRFQEVRAFVINSLDKDLLDKNLEYVAGNSWLIPEDKNLILAAGLLERGVVPENKEQEINLQAWQKGLSLILAEEYIHVLQHIYGGDVSSLRNMMRFLPSSNEFNFSSEADVAVYLQERGVELPDSFLDRYGVRHEALALLKGEQTEEQQKHLSLAVTTSPLNQWIAIGRELLAEERSQSLSLQDPDALSDVECFLMRLTDGKFTLEPSQNPTRTGNVFVQDDRGVFRPLKKSETVEPGTAFYIGGSYRFTL